MSDRINEIRKIYDEKRSTSKHISGAMFDLDDIAYLLQELERLNELCNQAQADRVNAVFKMQDAFEKLDKKDAQLARAKEVLNKYKGAIIEAATLLINNPKGSHRGVNAGSITAEVYSYLREFDTNHSELIKELGES